MSRTSSYVDEKYEECLTESQDDLTQQQEWKATHTNGGTPLTTLAYLTDLPLCDSRTAKVYWNKEANRFLLCPTDGWDFEIVRTPQSLRAFAKIMAFDPKEWGCRRCGCTAEFRDRERVCWCDACSKGCDVPVVLEPLSDAMPRRPSPFFASCRLPPPPTGPLERQIAVIGTNDAFLDDSHMSPLSPTLSAIPLSADDAMRFCLS